MIREAGGDEVRNLGHIVVHRLEQWLDGRGEPKGVLDEPLEILLALTKQAEGRAAGMQEGVVVDGGLVDDLVRARHQDEVLTTDRGLVHLPSVLGCLLLSCLLPLQRVGELQAIERLAVKRSNLVTRAHLTLGGH